MSSSSIFSAGFICFSSISADPEGGASVGYSVNPVDIEGGFIMVLIVVMGGLTVVVVEKIVVDLVVVVVEAVVKG